MRREEMLAAHLAGELAGKTLLELASGSAVFSLAAEKWAEKVIALDLDDTRLDARVAGEPRISFLRADAADTGLADKSVDCVVLYNSFYHVKEQWPQIRLECARILRPGGSLYVAATWKLDKALMQERLPGSEPFGEFMLWRERF